MLENATMIVVVVLLVLTIAVVAVVDRARARRRVSAPARPPLAVRRAVPSLPDTRARRRHEAREAAAARALARARGDAGSADAGRQKRRA